MPQIITQTNSNKILPQVRSFARVHPGSGWPTSDAAWLFVPLLQPKICRDCVAPEMPKAELVYNFGLQKREWTTQFLTELPGALDGYYVQILIQLAGQSPVIAWNGIIEHNLTRPESDTRLEGSQRFTAYGLARLFEKQPIDRMYAEQDSKVIEIRRLPEFNRRAGWGHVLLGNRSLQKKTHESQSTYVHSTKGDRTTWSALDVVELLVKRFRPTGWTVGLSGQWPALKFIKDVWDPNRWANVKVALDELISRRRGLGWFLWTAGFGPIWLHVFSYSDIPVSFGDAVLPANAWPTVLTLPSSYPWTHLLDPIEFAFSQLAQYDTIIIESEEFLRAMFTASYRTRGADLPGDDSLVEGWPTDTETTVRTMNAGGAAENDRARSDDRYEHVFTRHLIGNDRTDPTRFHWLSGNGEGGARANIAWTARDNGTVDLNRVSTVYLAEKTVERELPLLKWHKYDQAPVNGAVQIDSMPENTDPEYLPLLALIRDPLYKKPENDPQAPEQVYALLDHLDALSPPAGSMSVRSLDKGFGVQVGCSPTHRLARNHWANPTPSNHGPEFDYRDLIVTCSARLDQRLRVVLRKVAFPQHHTNRTHLIRVRDVEYWRGNEGTVIGVTTQGGLRRLHNDNVVLRDDGPRLAAFAAFVRHWFSHPRNAVQIPVKTLGLFAQLGSLLVGVQGVTLSQPINTVITARSMTFALSPDDEASLETRLETGAWSAEEAWPVFAG